LLLGTLASAGVLADGSGGISAFFSFLPKMPEMAFLGVREAEAVEA
jgi:hypothetical protein